mmetsp:Transcript_5920/g.14046  ORF Transcript_5920/g.14046 Transcript_5920/m.14046 type:complete len:299 (+) Transcript_5920:31-927(+)
MACRVATCAQQADLQGASNDPVELNKLLTGLDQRGVRFTEAHYIVNWWTVGEANIWLPLKHHGIILIGTPGKHILCLDFSRHGLVWDYDSIMPEMPDYTCHAETLKINTRPADVADYCCNYAPFNFMTNDCSKFSHGLLEVLKIDPSLAKPTLSQTRPPAQGPPTTVTANGSATVTSVRATAPRVPAAGGYNGQAARGGYAKSPTPPGRGDHARTLSGTSTGASTPNYAGGSRVSGPVILGPRLAQGSVRQLSPTVPGRGLSATVGAQQMGGRPLTSRPGPQQSNNIAMTMRPGRKSM